MGCEGGLGLGQIWQTDVCYLACLALIEIGSGVFGKAENRHYCDRSQAATENDAKYSVNLAILGHLGLVFTHFRALF